MYTLLMTQIFHIFFFLNKNGDETEVVQCPFKRSKINVTILYSLRISAYMSSLVWFGVDSYGVSDNDYSN